ncbi:MAG TPA: ferrous iron transport protein B, partial [Anaeromyxobacteraceae bacterium]
MTPPSSSAARSQSLDRKEVVASARSIILVGNPNVGKSVLFGALTGKYVTVSNYPGTTVEVTRGSAVLGGRHWHVMDTPGTNNLTPMSEDEQVTRDILLQERDYVCLQVCDAKNLRRGLLLAAQLAEAQVPFALALNMSDEAAGRGFHIDHQRLSAALGVDVVPTVAVQRTGVAALVELLAEARPSPFRPRYDEHIEAALAEVEPLVPARGGLGRRAVALMALMGDESLRGHLAAAGVPAADLARIDEARRRLASRYPESLRFVVSRQRLAAVDRLHDAVVSRGDASAASGLARRLGAWSTHPVLGIPILLGVLFAAYQFVGVFGAKTAVDFLENQVFYQRLVPWFDSLVRWLLPAGPVQEFLVGPAGVPFREHAGFLVGKYGILSMGLSYGMAIVLPIVATFFVAFSLLEDSGYLPRLAVMVNRVFKWMGLNGKAVLPMVLGLGCDTMATMTARIMETRKERVIVTLLLALGVPCSAQLAVIFAMLAGVSPGAAAWFFAAIAGVLFLVGWLAAKVIPGRGSDFMLELPPIRLPQVGNVAVKTLARIEWYLREALPLFVLGTLILWGLDRVGGLAVMERVAAPVVVGLLQLPKEAASAFILGFLRRDYAAAGLFMHY